MNWLSDEMFLNANPIAATITAVEERLNQWKNTEYVLYVRDNSNNSIFSLSLYKDNLNRLIQTFTDNSDLWIGKIILIGQQETPQGKKIRTIISA